MKRLTKKEAIRLHREMWTWLSKNPTARKNEWPRWHSNGGDIPSIEMCCFLCEYTRKFLAHQGIVCTYCPLQWPQGFCSTLIQGPRTGYLFTDWARSSGEVRSAIAEQIANLPERKVKR